MASPVAKLNRFSRLFSPKNFTSFHNVKTPSTGAKLDSTSELSILPDEHERLVETPSTNRSPTLCSTPDLGCKKKFHHRSRSHLVLNPANVNDLFSPNVQTSNFKENNLGLTKPGSLRSRCFGVSEAFTMSKKKVCKIT